ncbi:MAG TPA: T9SS type A sorting domain-containing protein [Ignavibacteria bacterium]
MNVFSKYKSFFISSLFISILQFIFIIDNCFPQWYQINLPVSGSVVQMQFINSNTGWATIEQSTYIYSLIRTTNQGTNWEVIYSDSAKVQKIQFINDTLGYSMGESHGSLLLKTINKGYNWTVFQSSQSYIYSGFYMVNADTGWVSAFLFPSQVTLMTTNGFQTLQQISTGGGGTPATLYFFKEKYNGEYYGYILGAGILSKTTNSGFNWQQINIGTSGNVNSFSFLNKDTGWVIFDGNWSELLYTSNNGQNWSLQFYYTLNYSLGRVQALNNNNIFCGTAYNSKVLKTTNNGLNWGNQYSQITNNKGIYMFDTLLGFSWNGYSSSNFARTLNGGGSITLIEKLSSSIPKSEELKQNYPNPFNSSTSIEFDIPKISIIQLKLYDILGKEVINIFDSKELNSGNYKVNLNFDNYYLSSGNYFYKLTAFEKEKGKLFQLTKKLVYNK